MGVYAEGNFEAFIATVKICVLILLTSFWHFCSVIVPSELQCSRRWGTSYIIPIVLKYQTVDVISITEPACLDCGANILFIPASH